MVEEFKGYKHDSVYYMSAHCNGNGKMMVKTTCEKLPQLEKATTVSISYNKHLSKRKSKSENKLNLTGNRITTDQHQITPRCNGHNNRLSDDEFNTKKHLMNEPTSSSSSHATIIDRHRYHNANISMPNCLDSKMGQNETSMALTTLVLPIGSHKTSSITENQYNNHIENQTPIKISSESLNLSSNTLGITTLTNLLKKRKVKQRTSESQIPELDSTEANSDSVVKPFQTYCKQTSLHGWKYVAFGKGTKFERICWLLFLLCALLIASNLVYRAVSDFISQTVSTNMDSMSMSFDNLYFPAITICNINFMQRSVLEKYGLQNTTLMDVFDRMVNTGSAQNFTDEELEMFKYIEERTNGTSNNLKLEGHPECHSMFLEYTWKNKEVPLYYMHYAQTTDASLCCQIFPGMLPSENNAHIDILNGSFWGQKNDLGRYNVWQVMFDGYKTGIFPGKQGIQVLIDVESYEYFSSHSSGSEGVLVLIQHYRDIPLMRKESFVLSPGFEVDVGLGVTQIVTTEPAISRFEPQHRHCYTHDEVNLTALPLEKGYRMSMKNCLYDKALHATIAECDCIPSFYVLGAIGKDKNRCIGKQLDCAYEVFDNVESPQRSHLGTAADKCQQPCNDQIYDSRITFARYPNRAMFGKRSKGLEVCKLSRKLLKICHGWVDEEAKGQCPFCHGDEFKIRKNVLEREYPSICESIINILGGNTTVPIAPEVKGCPEMRKAFLYSELGEKGLDILYTYAKKNLLWLNVYVKDSFATKIVRDEKVTITSFVANVGGLLGLCMGFSLVSVVEMVYFCIKEKLFGIIDALCGTNMSNSKTGVNKTNSNNEESDDEDDDIHSPKPNTNSTSNHINNNRP